MKLITYFQDCIHDKAISYHRKLRDKEMTKSRLDYIEGIGEKKRTLFWNIYFYYYFLHYYKY